MTVKLTRDVGDVTRVCMSGRRLCRQTKQLFPEAKEIGLICKNQFQPQVAESGSPYTNRLLGGCLIEIFLKDFMKTLTLSKWCQLSAFVQREFTSLWRSTGWLLISNIKLDGRIRWSLSKNELSGTAFACWMLFTQKLWEGCGGRCL